MPNPKEKTSLSYMSRLINDQLQEASLQGPLPVNVHPPRWIVEPTPHQLEQERLREINAKKYRIDLVSN